MKNAIQSKLFIRAWLNFTSIMAKLLSIATKYNYSRDLKKIKKTICIDLTNQFLIQPANFNSLIHWFDTFKNAFLILKINTVLKILLNQKLMISSNSIFFASAFFQEKKFFFLLKIVKNEEYKFFESRIREGMCFLSNFLGEFGGEEGKGTKC